jgi:hypothetical protein
MKRWGIPHNIPIGTFIRDVVCCFVVIAGLTRRIAGALRRPAGVLRQLAGTLIHCCSAETEPDGLQRGDNKPAAEYSNALRDIAVTLPCIARRLLQNNTLQ